MIAAWKRQAVEGMASTFAGASDVVRATGEAAIGFRVMALEEALARFGTPAILNADHGSQFRSVAFTAVLKDAVIAISMDVRGRWMDNVFIGRL